MSRTTGAGAARQQQHSQHSGILAGVTVLEIAGTPGACFAASLLADFGADVRICETLPEGSPMRRLGPPEWWSVLARNKRSVALDPTAPRANDTIRRLLASADVVVTDTVPADHPEDLWLRLLADLPRPPLRVDVVPSGSDRPDLWPWSIRADMSGATTGLMALTGWSDGPPIQPECPLAEYLAGALAATRAVAAIRAAKCRGERATGEILIPLHLAVLRMIEWQMTIATAMGRPELRVGNAFPLNAGIANMHLSRDGKYVAISAANQSAAERLLEMVGGPTLRNDPRFATVETRALTVGKIYEILDRWVGERSLADILAVAEAHDVVLGPIFDTDDISRDDTIIARRNFVEVGPADGIGLPMPSVVPRIPASPSPPLRPGPRLGADPD